MSAFAIIMPTLPRTRKSLGFTLVEVMIVLVIIGMMSGAAVMAWPAKKSETQMFSENLHTTLLQRVQAGLVNGETVALSVSDQDITFSVFQNEAWIDAESMPWPQDADVKLFVSGAPVSLPENRQPLIVFEPIGLSTPFTLNLRTADEQFELASQGDGRVTLERPE